jgi:hypothetical protein
VLEYFVKRYAGEPPYGTDRMLGRSNTTGPDRAAFRRNPSHLLAVNALVWIMAAGS